MIYSLGDRQLLTKGDYWIADNATIVGSVVLENNVSVAQNKSKSPSLEKRG